MKKVFFKTSDSLTLCGIWHIPKTETKKVVILAHGLTVTKDEDGIFTELAEILMQANIAVFRFDFRGHGESGGKSVAMTIAGELLDLHAAIHEVGKQDFESVGLLGASFGGGIATLFAQDFQTQLQALCLWNPCLNYDHTLINPILPWIADRNDIRKQEIKSQGWTTVGSRKFIIGKALYDELSNTFPYKALEHIIIPTCILHGTADTYVPHEDSNSYANALMNGEFISIEDGEHGFKKPQKQREEVLEKTVAFFKNNL
ncbi:MAG: alpha/beta hydrolase [Candidatus Levybacteria bacterium]|nr:alpha/beta hydrolase [Candidatus Levybacteria bacterium]